MLQATGIVKSYGNLSVLNGVDMEISQGEIVSIVGSSGAGKSTLLHILSSLDNPDGGTVLLKGINLHQLSKNELARFRNQHIGFVFQFHHLMPEFTALENVCIPAWVNEQSQKGTKERAMELLNKLGIAERAEHKPGMLSGGEQQRVAVARALMNKPAIIFADEPTGNLDSFHAKELHQLFEDIRSETGQTFLIVTHNEELANRSDRIFHMQDGTITNIIQKR
jgi:lipoprotein-releasing system ATP-binding protein